MNDLIHNVDKVDNKSHIRAYDLCHHWLYRALRAQVHLDVTDSVRNQILLEIYRQVCRPIRDTIYHTTNANQR